VVAEFEEFFGPDAGEPEHLDERPGPEGVVFLPGQVVAPAAGVLGPGMDAGLAGNPGEGLAGHGERAAGRSLRGGCQCLGGAGAVLSGGADQHRQHGQPLAGPGVHPRLAAPVFLAGVDVGLADRAGRGPRSPPGRVLHRPAGQVQVEGANREQGMPVGCQKSACPVSCSDDQGPS
jgi:hypothetical protein